MCRCKFCKIKFDKNKATNISGIIYCPNCGDTEQEEITE